MGRVGCMWFVWFASSGAQTRFSNQADWTNPPALFACHRKTADERCRGGGGGEWAVGESPGRGAVEGACRPVANCSKWTVLSDPSRWNRPSGRPKATLFCQHTSLLLSDLEDCSWTYPVEHAPLPAR